MDVNTALLTLALTLICFLVRVTAQESNEYQARQPAVVMTENAYQRGLARGQQDGAGGLSRTPARWESEYSQADRREFLRGYEAGYNQGIKPGAAVGVGKHPYGQPLTAEIGKWKVVLKEGRRTVAVLKTHSPNVE